MTKGSGADGPQHDLIVPASQISVAAGVPQVIKLAGFREVFEKYPDHLDNAVCNFGANDLVYCRCNTAQGTMECDVPKNSEIAHNLGEDHLVVKAKVAEIETVPLIIKYSIEHYGDHNVLLHTPQTKEEAEVPSLHTRILHAITRERQRKSSNPHYLLFNQCLAEMVGTMFIVIFGVGSVCAAVLTNGLNSGLWAIAPVWGFGVAIAILTTASVSGAHLNPAVSLALAMFRPKDFPFYKLLPYWAAQYLGGMIGGALNLALFGPLFAYREAQDSALQRGSEGSLLIARTFGEYFPDPGLTSNPMFQDFTVTPVFAMLIEAFGTGILMFVILALTDPRQKVIQNKDLLPFYIGFTVSVLITLYAPLTQAGWNPARDFGPRVVAALSGWGHVAIPGPRHGFWVYIIGPKLGAPIGALIYDLLINPGLTD